MGNVKFKYSNEEIAKNASKSLELGAKGEFETVSVQEKDLKGLIRETQLANPPKQTLDASSTG